MKKQTRKEKQNNTFGRLMGKSKYALKIARRKKYAAKNGVTDAPWPVLWLGFEEKG